MLYNHHIKHKVVSFDSSFDRRRSAALKVLFPTQKMPDYPLQRIARLFIFLHSMRRNCMINFSKRWSIAAIALAIVISMASLPLTGCPSTESGSSTGTPVAGDFDVSGLTQYLSRPIVPVSITPKEGKSSGAITIHYDGSDTLPTVAGTYSVTFDVAAATGWNAASGLSAGTLNIIEGVAPSYGITLSVSGTYTFPSATIDYDTPPELTVTVTNPAGNQVTGELSVTISSTNFELSPDTISSIASGANNTFIVKPKTGLAAGSHTATVTVSGRSNSISESFNVSFRVNDPATASYSITLSESGTYEFLPATVGYGEQASLWVTVTNTGNRATGDLTVALEGSGANNYFTLDRSSISSIEEGSSGAFTVVPKPNLSASTYTAVVKVSGGNGIVATFNVSFTVSEVIGRVEITFSEFSYEFPSATVSYPAQTPRTVTVTNTGNRAASNITIRLSGTNAGSFTLSPTTISNLAAGGTATFTVVPNPGLAVGSYTALVTGLLGDTPQVFLAVSFTVVANKYTITGSGMSFTAAKAGETVGTADQPIQTVIDAIRTDANGNASIIQFGNGADELDIGTAYVTFNGNWGPIALSGKITSAVTATSTSGAGGAGTIVIDVPVAITSTADIKNTDTSAASATPTSSHAVVHSSTSGTLTIQDGTIYAASGVGVRLVRGGTLTVNDGTVSTSSGIAVRSEDRNTVVNISGGTVSAATTGTAVLINGELNITSGTVSKTGTTGYTIINNLNGAVTISGGTVSRTASGTGVTIENKSAGVITVSGGRVSSLDSSNAVLNSSSGTVNINGGEVSAGYGSAIFNTGGFVYIYGGTISTTMGVTIRNRGQGTVAVSGPALVTSANSNITSSDAGTIHFEAGSSDTAVRFEIFEGTIENTAGIAIFNNSSSTLNIYGGTVSATGGGIAVFNNSSGTVNINGGTVSKTGTYGNAITNGSNGTIAIYGGTVSRDVSSTGVTIENTDVGSITVSGGTVSSTTGIAVRNLSQGKITVSGTARVTSANPDTAGTNAGTILLQGGTGGFTLEITGGKIENTSANGIAVYNRSISGIRMTGGEVSTTGANATSFGIDAVNSSLRISGGKVSANFRAITAIEGASVIIERRPEVIIVGTVYPPGIYP
jgi:hypothetical protein